MADPLDAVATAQPVTLLSFTSCPGCGARPWHAATHHETTLATPNGDQRVMLGLCGACYHMTTKGGPDGRQAVLERAERQAIAAAVLASSGQ